MSENQTNATPHGQPQAATAQPQIDPQKLNMLLNRIRDEQNLLVGATAGLAAALAGAVLWAVVTYFTKYQIGWMAVGVGFLVGYAVRIAGKGIDKSFGFTGAGLSFFGCALGNLLAICALIANREGLSLLGILTQLDFVTAGRILIDTFEIIDLLFYGIAIYEGYKISFRQLTEQELSTLKV
jgi:hypothetical protein